MAELIDLKETEERVLLFAVSLGENDDTEKSLDELEELVKTAGAVTAGRVIQNREKIHPATYLGKGKIDEVKELLWEYDATGVVCDDELSPIQLRNLEDKLETKVIDRTMVILDIFAGRARTREGKLQVELAQLKYRAARLVGLRNSLSRLGGGIGTRGPGEKKLEMDRRLIHERISQLKGELKEVECHRQVQRRQRERAHTKVAAIVGYTNAGKSTLLNAMLDLYGADEGEVQEERHVFEKDMLFATLDTTVRKIAPPEHHAFLLSDTVGFIHKLPHNLVEAFQSTLEEAKEADLLIQVVDYSDEHYKEQIAVTNQTLKKLQADGIPMLFVYNKSDLVSADALPGLSGVEGEEVAAHLPVVAKTHGESVGDGIYLSAKKRIGMEELVRLIEEKLSGGYRECTLLIPYTDGRAVSYLNENAVVFETAYEEKGVRMRVNCKKQDYGYYRKYAEG